LCAAKRIGIAKQRLAEANLILDYASDLADGVIDGTVTLDAAHHQATERKRATDSNTSRAHRAQRAARQMQRRKPGS
jgi:hypothetical protein